MVQEKWKFLRSKRRSNELSIMQERLTINNQHSSSTSRLICYATTLSWLIARVVKFHSRKGRELVNIRKKIC